MKANEFVKKYGIDRAKNITVFCLGFDGDSSVWDFTINDLKRLVESHELVEKVGGMDKAKLLLRMRIAAELYNSADEIEQAILDVELCQ